VKLGLDSIQLACIVISYAFGGPVTKAGIKAGIKVGASFVSFLATTFEEIFLNDFSLFGGVKIGESAASTTFTFLNTFPPKNAPKGLLSFAKKAGEVLNALDVIGDIATIISFGFSFWNLLEKFNNPTPERRFPIHIDLNNTNSTSPLPFLSFIVEVEIYERYWRYKVKNNDMVSWLTWYAFGDGTSPMWDRVRNDWDFVGWDFFGSNDDNKLENPNKIKTDQWVRIYYKDENGVPYPNFHNTFGSYTALAPDQWDPLLRFIRESQLVRLAQIKLEEQKTEE